MKRIKRLGVKISIFFVLFSLVLSLMIGGISFYVSYKLAVNFYSSKAEQAAALVASFIDGDRFRQMYETMDDTGYYLELKALMSTIKEDMELMYLFAYAPEDTYLVYVVEAQTPQDDPKLISKMGDVLEYGENEFELLVPDVEAARASTEPMVFGDSYFGDAVLAWAPVVDSTGKVVAMADAEISLSEVMVSIRQSVLIMLSVCVITIAVMGAVLLAFTRRSITVPITKLTSRTLAFAAGGELNAFDDDIKTGDEIQTLSEGFGKMAGDIEAYTRTQASVAADRERITTELAFASEMQLSMLPKPLPDSPNRACFDVEARLRPAKSIGGDFYDYFLIDDRWLYIVVCDVEKNGIQAAMLLTVAKTIIKSQMQTCDELAVVMSDINRQLNEAMESTVPILTFAGELDLNDGTFRYINAGYTAPAIMRRNQRYEWLTSPAYAPLAINSNVSYRALEMKLHQGDRLVVFSNGVVNAQDKSGKPFGSEKVRSTLNNGRMRGGSLSRVLDSVYNEVDIYTGDAECDDDMTMLALEYRKGDREDASIVLRAVEGDSGGMLAFIKAQLAENAFTGRDYAQTAVAAEEVFAMCCRKAVRNASIRVRCVVNAPQRWVTLHFTAPMAGSNPLLDAGDSAAVSAIAFIRKNSGEVTYSRTADGDTVTLTRTLGNV